MEPSISPDDREHANGESAQGASEQPTRIISSATTAPSVVAAGQHCAACGAALTPDQRYCVECGQRRGPLRMPAMDRPVQQPPAALAAGEQRRRGPRMSVNTTLIAGIGTLMLAMGVGVLIGRQATSSSGKPVQYVTVPGGTGAAGSGGESEAGGGTSTSESTSGSKSASAGASKAKKTVQQILKGKHAPPKPVVKIGTPGKGPGYQKGHFTGKFFGGAESEKEEEAEETAESTKTGKR